LYRDCPQWVPPLFKSAVNDFYTGEHPFFNHGDLELFLAENNGKSAGRIAVMENRHYNNFLGESTAFFGFYDLIDSSEVSKALFEAGFNWARKRGLSRIIGPRGLVSTENTGVLVHGFEHRAAMGLSYNYPYYDRLVKEAGFTKVSDSLSGYATADQIMPERLIKIAERIKERRGFEVIHFQDMKDADFWIPQVLTVLKRAFEIHPGYCPPTDGELKNAADNLLSIADPRLIKLIRKDDQVIGFIFAYHDVTAGLQRARGRIWPVGWMHLLTERKRTKWVNINGVGVLPEYQGMGVNAILYTEIKKSVDQFDFEHVDVVQVGEDNFQSRSDMETMGIRWYKSHRSYERNL
jgi:ribosomal protein S18 acetylase RimI-like enzyme